MRTVAIKAAVAALLLAVGRAHAQAALLMEEPYGFFGTVNPTGHNALYFARICAETPVKLRRCEPGEMGSVISRYQGIAGYDWIAIPLIPYLYSVEGIDRVPVHVDREMVEAMRDRYHEAHLLDLGADGGAKVGEGNLLHGGWTELVGAAYERRIYAFRFETTQEQDDALMAKLNDGPNRSHFEMLYNNCADFARAVLNTYFPHTFRRSLFPDAGITTPKRIASTLERYSRKHQEMRLSVFEIPLIPGYRHLRRSNNGVAEAFLTTGYAVPLALINPYIAAGIVIHYLVQGRTHPLPKNPTVLGPENLYTLTLPAHGPENPISAGTEAVSAVATPADAQPALTTNSGLGEIKVTHE